MANKYYNAQPLNSFEDILIKGEWRTRYDGTKFYTGDDYMSIHNFLTGNGFKDEKITKQYYDLIYKATGLWLSDLQKHIIGLDFSDKWNSANGHYSRYSDDGFYNNWLEPLTEDAQNEINPFLGGNFTYAFGPIDWDNL
jgi:hypothetical protein